MMDGSLDLVFGPLNLAPTASTGIAIAIGDAMQVVLIERAGTSLKDLAINHPAGYLGRQLTLPEVDLMVPALDLLLIETTTHLT